MYNRYSHEVRAEIIEEFRTSLAKVIQKYRTHGLVEGEKEIDHETMLSDIYHTVQLSFFHSLEQVDNEYLPSIMED